MLINSQPQVNFYSWYTRAQKLKWYDILQGAI